MVSGTQGSSGLLNSRLTSLNLLEKNESKAWRTPRSSKKNASCRGSRVSNANLQRKDSELPAQHQKGRRALPEIARDTHCCRHGSIEAVPVERLLGGTMTDTQILGCEVERP